MTLLTVRRQGEMLSSFSDPVCWRLQPRIPLWTWDHHDHQTPGIGRGRGRKPQHQSNSLKILTKHCQHRQCGHQQQCQKLSAVEPFPSGHCQRSEIYLQLMAYKQDCKSYPMAQAKMVFNVRVMHQTKRYQPPCPERIRHSQVRKSDIKESETRMNPRLRQEQAASKLDVFQFRPAAIVINFQVSTLLHDNFYLGAVKKIATQTAAPIQVKCMLLPTCMADGWKNMAMCLQY